MRKFQKQKIKEKANQGYNYNDYYDDSYYGQNHYEDAYEESYREVYVEPKRNKKTTSKNKNGYNLENTYPNEYSGSEVQIILDNKSSFTDMVNEKIKKEYSKPNEIKDQKKVQVLVIAEKPNIAKAIAAAYGTKVDYNIKENPERFTYSGAPYLTFESYFKGVPATFTVSSVFGHILGDGFESKYDEWNIGDPIDLYDVPIVKREEYPDKQISKTLRDLAYGKDILCLFLDCDNEGENICFETINCCYENMIQRPYQQIYRAKFSSLHPDDIKLAFSYLKELPNKNLSSSVDLRSFLDLSIGVSFTRYLTNDIFPHLDLKLKNSILSFGPCQTPTLGFCVKRSKEIDNFVPKYVHRVYMNLNIDNSDYIRKACFYKTKELSSEENTNLSKDEAFEQLEFLFSKDITKGAVVEEVIVKRYEKSPPVAMNTFELMRRASSYLHLAPYTTIMLAERLYSRGYISYPRTETTKHPVLFDHKKTLKALKENTIEASTIDTINLLLKVSSINPVSGVDRGDHPPIAPLKNDSGLKNDMKKLYDLVKFYYLASISSPAIIEEREYVLSFEGKCFRAFSSSIIKKGYLEVFPWDMKGLEKCFPLLEKNQVVKIEKFLSEKVMIPPPEYLTESELITLMEQNKIGTDASISLHIKNIINRKYVKVKLETRQLIPTNFGKALIEALEEFDSELVLPKIRKVIENTANELINGSKDYKSIVESSIAIYRSKLAKMISCKEQMLSIFAKHIKVLKSKQNIQPPSLAKRRSSKLNSSFYEKGLK